MKPTDVSLRCNLVTLSEEEENYEDKRILDHSAGEISTSDAALLLEAVKQGLETEGYTFYAGTSYRHLLIWDQGKVLELTPPHDVLSQTIGQYLPKDDTLREMMKKSYDILKNHPLSFPATSLPGSYVPCPPLLLLRAHPYWASLHTPAESCPAVLPADGLPFRLPV